MCLTSWRFITYLHYWADINSETHGWFTPRQGRWWEKKPCHTSAAWEMASYRNPEVSANAECLEAGKPFSLFALQMWLFDKIHWSAWQRKWSCGAAGMNWELGGRLQDIFKRWCLMRGFYVCAETGVWINLHAELSPEPGHSRAGNNSECLNTRKNHYLLSLVGQQDKDKNMVSRCHFCK